MNVHVGIMASSSYALTVMPRYDHDQVSILPSGSENRTHYVPASIAGP
jgi:hypothetical protein